MLSKNKKFPPMDLNVLTANAVIPEEVTPQPPLLSLVADVLTTVSDDFATLAHAKVAKPWRLLVVDDEEDVHSVTQLVLDGMNFEGRPIEILSAYSAKEARELLAREKNIAVILLDVVMETDDAGLQLVKFIREHLKDKNVRIILRTGESQQAPEESVIIDYDINDYKSKNELTAQRLFTTVIASLRAYESMFELDKTIASLNKTRDGLEKFIALSNKAQHQKMTSFEEAATTDYLTGLNNRRQLLRLGIPLVLNAHKNSTLSFAVALLDIDSFKHINDTYGLEMGDFVLKQLGCLLRQRFLFGDIVARFSGDKFCVIALQLNKIQAFELFDQFREMLARQAIILPNGNALKITASVGVSLRLRDGLDDMLGDADLLLYKAKKSGRNCVNISY